MLSLQRSSCTALVIGLLSLSSGCKLTNGEFRMLGDKPPAQSEPDALDDKWAFVGKEGRGHRPLEDERDPFKPMIMSKEAQAIERSLGYK